MTPTHTEGPGPETPDSLLARAFRALRANRRHEAEALFGKALEREPRNATALHQLGMLRLRGGDKAPGLNLLARAEALAPADPEILLDHADALLDHGDERAAKARLMRLRSMNLQASSPLQRLASTLTRAGEPEIALDVLEPITHGGVAPDEVWLLVGDIRLRLEQGERALADWERALQSRTRNVRLNAAYRIANWHLQNGRPAAAQVHFDALLESLRDGPRHPFLEAMAWCGRGRALLDCDTVHPAFESFNRALGIMPGLTPARLHLAECLFIKQRETEALTLIEEVLKREPENVQALLLHAYVMIESGRYSEAGASLARVLELAPENTGALLTRARLQRIMGEPEASARSLREALRIDPGIPAYLDLSQLGGLAPGDPLAERLEERYGGKDPEGTKAEEDALFALYRVHERAGNHARAARYLRRANAAHRSFTPCRLEPELEQMARIARLFSARNLERIAGSGDRAIRPIFIASLPRSGSTLTEQMLASHSRVTGGEELPYMTRIANELMSRWAVHDLGTARGTENARRDAAEAAARYVRETAALHRDSPYFTDKNLGNFLYIGLISALFPRGAIVHVRRHPLATALGLYRQRFARGLQYTYDLDDIARYYKAYERLMRHWRETLADRMVEVCHEALVTEPEARIRRTLAGIGLEFEPACLRFHESGRPVSTASLTQVRQPLNREGVERHEHYRELLAPVADTLASEIRAYEKTLQRQLDGDE